MQGESFTNLQQAEIVSIVAPLVRRARLWAATVAVLAVCASLGVALAVSPRNTRSHWRYDHMGAVPIRIDEASGNTEMLSPTTGTFVSMGQAKRQGE